MLNTRRRITASALLAPLLVGAAMSSAANAAPPHRTAKDDVNPIAVTIDSVSPHNLARGADVRISGTLTNTEDTPWTDVQVFLNIDAVPIRTQAQLDAITAAGPNIGFGSGPAGPGLYDEVDTLAAHETRSYALRIPQADLGSPSTAGVYHFGVRVLGTNSVGRDALADGRADTFIPLIGKRSKARADVLLLVPLTAPVHRWPDGSFMDDSLGRLVTPGGRLDNVLSLLGRAPPHSVQVVVDPAVVDALDTMAKGYRVKSAADLGNQTKGRSGGYQSEAAQWLTTLSGTLKQQSLLLLPYADPDATSLRRSQLTSVLRASIVAAKRVAASRGWTGEVAGWSSNGLVPRQVGTGMLDLGADLLVLSDQTLDSELREVPAAISYRSDDDHSTAVVTRSRLADVTPTATSTPTEFGRALLARATIAAVGSEKTPVVAATDFAWDPGPNADAGEVFGALESSWVVPTSVDQLRSRPATPYAGAIKPATAPKPALSSLHLAHLTSYAHNSAIYTHLVGTLSASDEVGRNLALAGSAQWQLNPRRGELLASTDADLAAEQVSSVTVTGPSSIALSSNSGRFPVTVTNRLPVPVTVRVVVRSSTSGIQLKDVAPIVLDARQRRDIEMFGSAKGSTVANVEIQLATSGGQRFGNAWDFNVRSTQFGLLIWIIMAVGLSVLLGTAGWRVMRRVRQARATHAAPSDLGS